MRPERFGSPRAIFDVKPTLAQGVHLAKINYVASTGTVNLRQSSEPNIESVLVPVDGREQRRKIAAVSQPDHDTLAFDLILNQEIENPKGELVRLGGVLQPNTIRLRPRPRMPIARQGESSPPLLVASPSEFQAPDPDDGDFNHVLRAIHSPLTVQSEKSSELSVSPKLAELRSFYDGGLAHHEPHAANSHEERSAALASFMTDQTPVRSLAVQKPKTAGWKLFSRKTKIFAFSFLVFGSLTYYFGLRGFDIRNELLHEGRAAVGELTSAGESLKELDFEAANQHFLDAYEEFSRVSGELNVFGGTLSSLVGQLPGGGKLRSAKNLAEIGKAVAESGSAMTSALAEISRAAGGLNPQSPAVPIGSIARSVKDALFVSKKNIDTALALIGDVDESIIPVDKRQIFREFTEQLPVIRDTADDAYRYAQFFEELVGSSASRTYILLFQNSSELRPTGGFPGTYGLVTFENGRLKEFKVDDVYNLDGQLKKMIVPPEPLQHIVPNWAMRDANWFIDFPTSARKIMWFFNQEAGYSVDGVITIDPSIVSKILAMVGPVEMPEYGLTVTADNFLEAIQGEVEYGPNRTQPKKVVMDFAPRFLEKIYSADRDRWMAIFQTFIGALDERYMLMHFANLQLRDFALSEGFAGQVNDVKGDYLNVNIANVKGSKGDAYTDTFVDIDTTIVPEGVRHRLVITRQHNGGAAQYGFYNRQNPAFVRILVPKGAELVSAGGQDQPRYQPLLDYSKAGFSVDEDLEKLKGTFQSTQVAGVQKFTESGRDGFAFWMIVDPGRSKEVTLEYLVPQPIKGDYSFYFQKQPSLDIETLEFHLKDPEHQVTKRPSNFFKIGDTHVWSNRAKTDLEFTFTLSGQ